MVKRDHCKKLGKFLNETHCFRYGKCKVNFTNGQFMCVMCWAAKEKCFEDWISYPSSCIAAVTHCGDTKTNGCCYWFDFDKILKISTFMSLAILALWNVCLKQYLKQYSSSDNSDIRL